MVGSIAVTVVVAEGTEEITNCNSLITLSFYDRLLLYLTIICEIDQHFNNT